MVTGGVWSGAILSAGSDVRGARTLGARLDVELDLLAAHQAVEVERCVNAASVEEVFLGVIGRDETEAAVRDDLLDRARGHVTLLLPERGNADARSVREG